MCIALHLNILYHLKKSHQIPSTVLELCPEQESFIKGNNSKRQQGRVKVLVYCIASQCFLSFYEVSTKSLE